MVVALWFPVPSRGLVAVSVTTATAATWFAGLGFVYLESPASFLLAVHGRNRRLSLRIGAHLHESEPFAPVRTPKTWDQIAAFVGHLDRRTTQRYIHFMPRDKRDTANSIPFEF